MSNRTITIDRSDGMRTAFWIFAVSGALALGIAPASRAGQPPATTCRPESFDLFNKELIAAQNAFQLGNAEPLKALWSHAEDVTLMGAYGGHERGWDLVGARLSRVAGMNAKSGHDDKVLSRVIGSNMAVVVQLEHIVTPDAPPSDLRVTHVARCEGSSWRVVHRHADPLVETKMPAR
jgi:hypothetical protein